MADVSVIKDLTGTSYNIKDSVARSGLSEKLDANQGSANSGKVLGIDTDGSVIPVEGGGGSDLPSVTSSDNGKALGVVEGEWAATDIFAPKASPVFTGSISLGRSSSSTVGSNSFAVGSYLTASGNNSHAEGSSTTASGSYSHAEGANTYASGTYSHAENNYSKARGYASHAEGDTSLASNNAAHSEGYHTIACAAYSHAEGGQTKAVGTNSHAEGGSTEAYGIDSHAEGFCTIAIGSSEHVSGQYNVADTAPAWVSLTSYAVGDVVSREESFVDADNVTRTTTVIYKCVTANSDETFTSSKWTTYGQYLEVVGNGKTTSDRSNARALDWDGNEYLKGDIYVGCNKNSANGTKLTPPIAMTGATSSTAGSAGYVPAPSAGDEGKYLKGDGTWGDVESGGASDVAFDIATTDWTAVTGGYQAEVTNSLFTTTSIEIVTYTDSIENLNGNISKSKDAANHKMIFFVTAIPSGTISGNICTISSAAVNGIPSTEKGIANGVATLDANAKVPTLQMPFSVSDSLSDTSTTDALSAAKGKELSDNTQKILKTGTTEVQIVAGGYVTGSGNYFDFFLPCPIDTSKTYTVSLTTSISIKTPSANILAANIGAVTVLGKYFNGLYCEVAFATTQTPSVPGTISAGATITVS